MKWKKKGLIFCADQNHDWMHSYSGPLAVTLVDDKIRVYFSTRGARDSDGNFATRITFLECEKKNPSNVTYIHDSPLLSFGKPGAFDEHGTMIADVIRYHNSYYMYYMGWQRSETVPYLIRVGLALSRDGVEFEKISDGPVVGMSRHVPYGIGNVSISIEDGTFHMWFTRYKEWLKAGTTFSPQYDIWSAASPDGLSWEFGTHCIAPTSGTEAIATPSVIRLDGEYHMWYSYRAGVEHHKPGSRYEIGYAFSSDGVSWKRDDENVGIGISESGWDSEMICYPRAKRVGDKLLMFYCGNSFGRDGFGYAELE